MSVVSFQQQSLDGFTCHTYINDLIRGYIKSYINFSPDGQEGFYTALVESKVLGLILNSHRREWIQRYSRRKQK